MSPNTATIVDTNTTIDSFETAPEDNKINPVEIDEENPVEKNLNTFSTKGNLHDDVQTKKFVVVVAAAAALGGLIFGYDIGGAGMLFLLQYLDTAFDGISHTNCHVLSAAF
jgi:hypothetical protein